MDLPSLHVAVTLRRVSQMHGADQDEISSLFAHVTTLIYELDLTTFMPMNILGQGFPVASPQWGRTQCRASLSEAPELQQLALNFLATFFSRHPPETTAIPFPSSFTRAVFICIL